MFLVDTNIFLEILLKQEKTEECENFLFDNSDNLNMTDFSLHSIGLILFRYNKEEVFRMFIDDLIPTIRLRTMPLNLYGRLIENKRHHNLDFDDAYQFSVAKQNRLKLVTMDDDFQKVKGIDAIFI